MLLRSEFLLVRSPETTAFPHPQSVLASCGLCCSEVFCTLDAKHGTSILVVARE